MLHVENLTHPHPEFQNADSIPRPLLAEVDPASIREDLEDTRRNAPQDYYERRLTAANFVCEVVRGALFYPETKEDIKKYNVSFPIGLERAEEEQIANCHGFTIAASEALSRSGIEHWVGFANRHTTLLLPTQRADSAFLLDPLSPYFNQDLKAASRSSKRRSVILPQSSPGISMDIAQYGRSALFLNTRALADNSKPDTDELFATHPWLIFDKRKVAPVGQAISELRAGVGEVEEDVLRKTISAQQIVMSVFSSPDGRQMIRDFNSLQQAFKAQNLDGAVHYLSELGPLYPDMDARTPRTEIRGVLRHMAKQGKIKEARNLLQSHTGSYELSDDTRFDEFRADCLQTIAFHGSDLNTATWAIEVYQQILDKPNAYTRAIRGKLDKTRKLHDELARAMCSQE